MGSGLSKQVKDLPFAYALAPGASLSAPRPDVDAPLEASTVAPTLLSNNHSETFHISSPPANTAVVHPLETHSKKPIPTHILITLGHLSNPFSIGLCSQHITSVTKYIGLLNHTETLQLCCNHLASVPPEIGHLSHLTSLSLAKNELTELPDTIGLLKNLVDLKVNQNRLTLLPRSLGLLSKLTSLNCEDNQLVSLPYELGHCTLLEYLDCARNALQSVPCEIARLKHLKRLDVQQCPLYEAYEPNVIYSVPSLREMAARVIVRQDMPLPTPIAPHLIAYLSCAGTCSTCQGPYFETHYKRIKFADRHEQLRIPYEYRLCCRHWNTEQERISTLFARIPETAPVHLQGETGSNASTSQVTSPVTSPSLKRLRRMKLTRSASLASIKLLLTKNQQQQEEEEQDGSGQEVNESTDPRVSSNSRFSIAGVADIPSSMEPLAHVLVKSPSLPSLPLLQPETQHQESLSLLQQQVETPVIIETLPRSSSSTSLRFRNSLNRLSRSFSSLQMS